MSPPEALPRDGPLHSQLPEQRTPGGHRGRRAAQRRRTDASPLAAPRRRGALPPRGRREPRCLRGGAGGGELPRCRGARSRRAQRGVGRALLAADRRAGRGDRHGRGHDSGAGGRGHGQDRRDRRQDRPPRAQPGRPTARDPRARLQPQGRRGDRRAPPGRPRRRARRHLPRLRPPRHRRRRGRADHLEAGRGRGEARSRSSTGSSPSCISRSAAKQGGHELHLPTTERGLPLAVRLRNARRVLRPRPPLRVADAQPAISSRASRSWRSRTS